MKTFRTPQEKKRLSYKKDCRNTYGENDKASRKAIPKHKRWVNKTYRRDIKQAIDVALKHEDMDIVENAIKEVSRKPWKKFSDKPLGAYLKQKGKL